LFGTSSEVAVLQPTLTIFAVVFSGFSVNENPLRFMMVFYGSSSVVTKEMLSQRDK